MYSKQLEGKFMRSKLSLASSRRITTLLISLLLVLAALLFSACSGSAGSQPARAAEDYYRALVDRDASRLANLSCAAWEADAQNELASFDAVSVSLEGLECQEAGTQGDTTLAACQGKIIANYGNEVLELNLADRTVKVLFEGGEWRVCGYQ
jgi:hypothetical protein